MVTTVVQPEEGIDDLVGDSPLRAQRGVASADRSSRQSDDRTITENRELTDDERFELYAETLYNDVLPDIPPIPGFHVCWLSTTHQADTIPRRMRMGYTPVRPDEIAGMEFATLKTGEYAGFIGVNEMVAFKISEGLYQRFMQKTHHDDPARQVEGIQAQIDSIKGKAESDGGAVIEDEGMLELRQSAPSRGRFI